MRMEYIHEGRVNYIRELYYTAVTCGIDSTHGWGLPGADLGFVVRGGVSRRGIWGPLKVPSGSRTES